MYSQGGDAQLPTVPNYLTSVLRRVPPEAAEYINSPIDIITVLILVLFYSE